MSRRVLCVAEKPSIAKDLAKMLSRNMAQSSRTASVYNQKFEFPYPFEGQQCHFVVTSISGHLIQADFDERFRKWSSCEPLDLLKVDTPVIKFVPDDKKDLEKMLKEEGRKANVLICFLDGDREGENISFEVIDVCRSVNPRIQIRRAKFSAVIEREITRAMNNLVAPDKNLSDSVDARSEIDLRVGAAFTRFQTLCLAKAFDDLQDKILSWGPCQFATLGFIVDRAWKIDRFVPEDFWSVNMALDKGEEEGRALFEWSRGRLFDHGLCTALYEEMLENPEAIVTSVRENIRRKWKPRPLATVELQTLASRKLHMSSERTMSVAEELYNAGIISYPRTETEIFKEGTDLRELVSKQLHSQQWGAFANMLLNHGGFEWPKPGKNDDMAHPPIHPTAFAPDLDGEKKKLYELIVRHFLACCSKDAIGAETVVEAEIADEVFVSKGLMIKERNYLEVYTYEKWSDKILPVFVNGEAFHPTDLQMTNGRTQAPSLLSEADLIQMMNRHGIGTDATIAQHITTVQQRDYALRDAASQQFTPTQLGKSLVTGYERFNIKLARPEFRAKMEEDMKAVAEGRKQKQNVVIEWMQIMSTVLKTCFGQTRQLRSEMQNFFQPVTSASWRDTIQRNLSKCGDCDGTMNLKRRVSSERSGDAQEKRALVCRNCDVPYEIPLGDLAPVDDFQCPICNFQVLQVTSANGGNYKVCPKCFSNPPQGVNTSNMRCFQCTDPRCKFATGSPSDAIRPCWDCGSDMRLHMTKERKYSIVCQGSGCKARIWLPGGAHSKVTILDSSCSQCQSSRPVRHLKFQFKAGSVPPHFPRSIEGCIGGCTRELRDLIEDENNPSIHERIFFRQGPAMVAIHRSNAGNRIGGGGSGGGGGSSSNSGIDVGGSGGNGGTRNVLGQISHASSRVNGHDMDIEDGAVGSRLDSFLSTSTGHVASSSRGGAFGGGGGRMGGGGGGGGGAEGAGRSGHCFKCGQEGHWASNCPMSQGAGGSAGIRGGSMGGGVGGLTCFKCGQPGHFANNCPVSGQQERGSFGGFARGGGAGSGGAGGNTCFKCGEVGHWAPNCPNSGPGGRGSRTAGGRGRGSRGLGTGGKKKK